MFSTIASGTLHGINSHIINVEVDTTRALPGFDIVGDVSSQVKEARERVRVALKNSKIDLPPLRITVNLSPANIKKEGPAFDLPIAIGIIASIGNIPESYMSNILIVGELGLGGEVKFVKGILPIVMEAKKQGYTHCIVPSANVKEGQGVEGIAVIGVQTLTETIEYLKVEPRKRNGINLNETENQVLTQPNQFVDSLLDFSNINGQETVKRAVEIAAAGFHHLLMVGPPGSGKTMIAKRVPTILPPLSMEESLEVSKIYSVTGLLHSKEAFITKRPFINPHHTITESTLAGGGRIPRPGLISLAHRGVLFLDELPEFKRRVLEVMRQPLEDKVIHISRNHGSVIYPAKFQFLAAMNPCPCGYYPNRNKCNCTPFEIKRYMSKISGPILDRIDLCVEVPKLQIKELFNDNQNEKSETIRERVMIAREIQKARFDGVEHFVNADMNAADIKKYCPLSYSAEQLLERIFVKMDLSARAYQKMIKVARTIADLDASDDIRERHFAEASMYRLIDERSV